MWRVRGWDFQTGYGRSWRKRSTPSFTMQPGSITFSTIAHSAQQMLKAPESLLSWQGSRVASNFTSFPARRSSDGPQSEAFSNEIQTPKCPDSTSVTRRRSGSQNSLYSKLVNKALMPEYIDRLSSQRQLLDSGIPRTS